MPRCVFLALAAIAALLPVSLCPAAAQSPDPCTPNYARISRMQGLLHWDHFPLRIALASPPDSVPDKDAYRQAVLAGFAQWVEASRGLVSYTLVAQPKQADITVSFTPEGTVPGQGAAVGYTSMIFRGTCLHGAEMCLATGNATPGDMQTVAAHEFGHALGIDGHSDDPDDIMYPSTLRTVSENGIPVAPPLHPITARDLNTLKVCYSGLPALHLAARPQPLFAHGHLGAALLGARRTASHPVYARHSVHR